jgi:hypothetical protein
MTHSIIHRLLHEPRWTKGFLFVLTVVLYVNSFNHSFNLDDQLVTDSHRLTSRGVSAIAEIIRSPYYQDDLGYSYDYRPVTHISFALQHQLFGPSARAGHMINVLLYALSVLLVFSLSRKLLNGLSPWGPLAVASLFAVHPMHTEVVCSLKNRDEMLSLLFSLLALTRLVAQPSGLASVLSSAPLMLLALLSKLSVAPLLLLAPMLGGIMGLDRRLVAVTGAMVLSVFVPVLMIRDWPLWWLAAIIAVMAMMQGLSHVARHPEAMISFWRKWLSLSVPRAPLTWNPFADAKTAIAHLLAAMPLVAFAVTDDTAYLLFSAALAAILPFWTGKPSGLLLVNALVAIAVYQGRSIHHSLFVWMAVYTLFSLRAAGADRRKQLIAVSMVASTHFLSTLYNLGNIGTGLLTVVSYMPLQLYLSTKRKRESVVFLIVLAAATVIAMVIDRDVDSAVIVFGLMAMLMFMQPNTGFKFSDRVESVAPLILLTLAVVSALVLHGHTANWLAPRAVSTEAVTIPAQAREVATTIEDRPLTLVEFPLDAYAERDVHLGTASAILGHYLKMMFIPWPQAFYYGFDEVPLVRMSDPRAIASVVIHSFLLLVALFLMRTHPVVSFGIIAYVASIALFSNLVSPVAGMIGDRLTYVASFGFSLSVGAGLGLLLDRLPSAGSRRVLIGVIGAVLLMFGGMTIARSALWKDPLTLMSHDIKHVPSSSQANYLLGYNLMQASFKEKSERRSREMRLDAITYLKKAASIFPDYLNYWHDLGKAYRDIGDLRSALPCFKEVHRLDSTFFEATFHVGMIAEELGMEDMAIDYYQRCIRINPGTLTAYNNLAFLHFKKGRMQESIAVNRMAIAQNAKWGDPYENIARAYHQLQMPDSVQYYMQRKAQLN